MASYDDGKAEIVEWVKRNFQSGSTCLDVGACDGKWSDLLGDYLIMDAVEIFRPNVEKHHLFRKYRGVFVGDIAEYRFNWYDLVIFGDVIEHMTVEQAQEVLTYAKGHCHDMIVSVPFLYPQDAIYGNPWEKHIQDDLTEEIFLERYPGFEKLLQPAENYVYWHAPRS